MAREREGFRDMLSFLAQERNIPLVMSRCQAAEALKISRTSLNALIADGYIKVDRETNKIPIGSLAKYLCG